MIELIVTLKRENLSWGQRRISGGFSGETGSVKSVKIPAQSPNCNPYADTIERLYQGIGGQLVRNVGPTNDNGADGKVACRSRLGGLLNFYYRKAA